MTRIDFYVMTELRLAARDAFAARLACKAFRNGQRVFIKVNDKDRGEQLDTLLWTHPDSAFLPHAQQGATEAYGAPVIIGTDATRSPIHHFLINLGDGVADGYTSFERVAEIVIDDDDQRAAARSSYRHYRNRGYPLYHHQIEAGS